MIILLGFANCELQRYEKRDQRKNIYFLEEISHLRYAFNKFDKTCVIMWLKKCSFLCKNLIVQRIISMQLAFVSA